MSTENREQRRSSASADRREISVVSHNSQTQLLQTNEWLVKLGDIGCFCGPGSCTETIVPC